MELFDAFGPIIKSMTLLISIINKGNIKCIETCIKKRTNQPSSDVNGKKHEYHEEMISLQNTVYMMNGCTPYNNDPRLKLSLLMIKARYYKITLCTNHKV